MKELPEDLAVMEVDDLEQQAAVRDERLERLFRRWPALNRVELTRLRTLYAQRVRIARHLGRRRRRTAGPR